MILLNWQLRLNCSVYLVSAFCLCFIVFIKYKYYYFSNSSHLCQCSDCPIKTKERNAKGYKKAFDFDESVINNSILTKNLSSKKAKFFRAIPQNTKPIDTINFLRSLYVENSHCLDECDDKNKKPPKIPLIIHQFWIGKPMPNKYKKWQRKWHKMHPNWKLICWNNELISKFFPNGLYNQKLYDEAIETKFYCMASDIVRYEVVYKFGGLYTDSDIEPFRKFDHLHCNYDFYCGLEPMENKIFVCNNGIYASKPGHPILHGIMESGKAFESKDILMDYPGNWYLGCWYIGSSFHKQLVRNHLSVGPTALLRTILKYANKFGNRDIVLPPELFGLRDPIDGSMCAHRYESTWSIDAKKKLNDKENQSTIKKLFAQVFFK
jgi:hypothetical protein